MYSSLTRKSGNDTLIVNLRKTHGLPVRKAFIIPGRQSFAEVDMDSGIAIIVISCVLAVTFAYSIVTENRKKAVEFKKSAEKNWGKKPKLRQSAEEFESISHYFKDRKTNAFTIDDITWNDCGMDDIFRMMNSALSSPGEDVLYAWLREPAFDDRTIAKRNALMEYFSSNAERRLHMQRILYDVGRLNKMSFYDYISQIKKAGRIGKMKYIAAGLMSAAGILLLFVFPLAGVLLLMPALFINFFIHISQRDKTQTYIRGFSCVIKLIDAGKQIAACTDTELVPLVERAEAATRALSGFKTGAFFVTSGGRVGTGLGDTILEYLKMFFHLDLIKFDSMVETFAGHEDECMDLLDVVGTIDAAIAAASFRQLLPCWCHGSVTDETVISGKEMYHPLLMDPVPNSFICSGGNLITGSNASGKSTFLKNIAIGQILMQSIDTVPAKEWSAPYMKVVTSMALTDNLLGGESYFVVEIRSLKRIVDMAEGSDVPVLGIVDEVLRGTNTIERIAASSKILETLAGGNAIIFAATHDIELSYILEPLYRNLHFEEEIDGGDVRFSYKLMEGRALTRNAIRLLGIAGYSSEVVESARKMAEEFEKTGEWDRVRKE